LFRRFSMDTSPPPRGFQDREGRRISLPGFGLPRILLLDFLHHQDRSLQGSVLAAILDRERPDEALELVSIRSIHRLWPWIECHLWLRHELWTWVVEAVRRELPGLLHEPPPGVVRSMERWTFGAGYRLGDVSGVKSERLGLELGRFQSAPEANGLARILELLHDGASLSRALGEAQARNEDFSALQLAFELSRFDPMDEVLELKWDLVEISARKEFAGYLAIDILELCLESGPVH
jgi:hypothetical protein